MIFSLGVGRPRPDQRTPYTMGQLSEEHGREGLVTALTRARRATHIVSCVSPDALEPQKLEHGALDFYRLMRAPEAPPKRVDEQQQAARITEKMPDNELLAGEG